MKCILSILKKTLKKNGILILFSLSLLCFVKNSRSISVELDEHRELASISVKQLDDVFLNAPDPTTANSFGEFKAFDPTKITHVYRIGHKRPYGRSNNQVVTILHAIDRALDTHGDLPNNRAVVAISGWASNVLKKLFHDGSNSTEFHLQLEDLRPMVLVHADRLKTLGLTEKHNKTQVWLKTKDTYYYIKKSAKRLTPNIIKNRRIPVLGALLEHGIAKKNLILHNAIKDHIIEKRKKIDPKENGRIPYVTIHSRWLEGECERRVGSLLPKDECWMTPSYIKSILGDAIGDMPIVLIGDGQNKEVIENLKKDSDIGPSLIVAEEINTLDGVKIPQPWSDMAIAIMSDIFIGTRVSTFATVVGMSRIARGADPASNFIYTSQNDERDSGSIEICEDCLFLCDKDQSHLCGDGRVYS